MGRGAVKSMYSLKILILAGFLIQSTTLPRAYAQNDELDSLFDQEDMEEPPGTPFNQQQPPPPPPGTGQTDFGLNNGGTPPLPPDDANNAGNDANSAGVPRHTFPTPQNTKTATGPTVAAKPGKAKVDAAHATVDEMTNENFPDIIESFDYPNAEITDVIKAISQLTGKNFIVDPAVRGKISIIAPTQITVAEAYKAFLAALAVNGFTVVPYGNFLKVKSSRYAQRDGIETYGGAYAPNADIYITRIIHLKHTSAEEINKRLRILPSKDGDMVPYEPTNSLIITDYGANVERMVKIINELDRPGFEEQMSVIPIRYAHSKDLADLINQIINKDPTRPGSGPSFGAGVPRFPRARTTGSGTTEELSLVASDDRTNAIIAVGNSAGIEKVKDLVKKLDYKLDPAEAGGVFVYYVRYGEAEKIAQTLSGVTGNGANGSNSNSAPGAGPGGGFNRFATASPLNSQNIFGGDVKITADKNTNSLVITASKQDYDTVLSILSKIDIPRDQVFVEAIIMEMITNKNNTWNPTYYALDPDSKGIGRAGFSRAGNLTNILNPLGDAGTVLGFGGGGGFDMTVNNATVHVPSLLAFLNIVQSNLETNILSTPQILALDNEEATIEVGDQLPIAQDTTTTAAGTTTNTRMENASIKLVLTPFIRPDTDVVRLKLEQTVKQPTKTTVASDILNKSTTILSNRTIKTNIIVSGGDTAVLGGLIRDQEDLDEQKIPILGDIPVLGWLFKSRVATKQKINLVVFMTPKILRNSNDGHKLLNVKASDRIDWVKKNFSGRDPYGHKIDTLPRTAQSSDDMTGTIPNVQKKKR